MSNTNERKSTTKGVVCHGICRSDGELMSEDVNSIHFQPGCAVEITLPGRENHRETKLAWIEGNYLNHILVRIDTDRGPYRMSIDKTDIALNRLKPDRGVKVKEIV